MRNIIQILVVLALLTSCKKQNQEYAPVKTNQPVTHHVKVKEVKQTGDYTYLQVEEGNRNYWMAINSTDLKPGDDFSYSNAVLMTNFESKDLNRVFDEIYFADTGAQQDQSSNSETKKSRLSKEEQENISVEKAKGGITIAELYENKENYKGKTVLVKGKIVKINDQIMDKNWVHLKDGTSFDGKSDLTFTTQESLTVGDVVTMTGKVTLDKDFGAGYIYPLIVEEASSVKE
ncbi:GW dipeptide domain-containing protein [Namhaeicola litoreus]|uniref:GW dipeptide domain-containing protein n=1 Tax=Namhaeicola litoreus TaxID=1052145 RepID=A0ABW3XZ47_9FLAO